MSDDEIAHHYHRLAQSPDLAQRELAAEQLHRLEGRRYHDAQSYESQTCPQNGGVDLVVLIEQTTGPLHRRGNGSATGSCPWHGSKSGSCLVVWPEEGHWWCCSCRRGGDAAQWMALIEGIDYHHARRRLGVARTGRRQEQSS